MSCFSSAPGLGLTLWIADARQHNPRWRITGGKRFDQAFENLVVRRRGFNVFKRPGGSPAFSASVVK
jgi:hypothetical protein